MSNSTSEQLAFYDNKALQCSIQVTLSFKCMHLSESRQNTHTLLSIISKLLEEIQYIQQQKFNRFFVPEQFYCIYQHCTFEMLENDLKTAEKLFSVHISRT